MHEDVGAGRQTLEGRGIENRSLTEAQLRVSPDRGEVVEGAVREVVEAGHGVTVTQKLFGQIRADEPRDPSHRDFQVAFLFLRVSRKERGIIPSRPGRSALDDALNACEPHRCW